MKGKLSRLSARERVLLIVAVCFLLAVLVDHLIVKAMRREFERIDQRVALAQRDLAHSLGVLEKAHIIERGAVALAAMPNRTGNPAEQNARIKQTVETLANRNRLFWQAIGNRDHRDGVYETYVVEVSEFEADEKNVAAFLHDVRSGSGDDRMMRTEFIRLQAARDTPGKVTGSLRLSQAVIPK